jgi:hypothetical protein
MISIKQFFASCGLKDAPERIKLVRHSGFGGHSIQKIIADGAFDFYQAEQDEATSPFQGCDVILSFLAIEGKRAEFHGAYHVTGHRPMQPDELSQRPLILSPSSNHGRLWYELAALPSFLPLRGRLITQWPNPRRWFQTKDLPLEQLLPPGNAMHFPGFQDLVLNWQELRNVIDTPQLHREWRPALSATGGIYRIVDHGSGKIYIGSASGTEGIWGRWRDYAKTGHGGNEMLRELDPKLFQWSIVRTLSGSMSRMEIVRIEHVEMRKHGSKAIGLNPV